MSTLDVTIVQADLHWHDAKRNLDDFDIAINSVETPTDLIVLPEMFTTGFSMDAPTLSEPMDGPSVRWMHDKAKTTGAAVCGSLIIQSGSEYYNRFIFITPDGGEFCYDKRHLFRLADEQHHYAAGSDLITFEYRGFRICPMVCYDLRFPVWSRNRDSYDLVIFVANWPSRRHHAWHTLLRARAIENLSYCVGVNRVGTDGNELPYSGGSAIIDYLGHELADLGDQPGVATAALKMDDLLRFRERFAFHKDADDFTLTP
jgi:predicted amidohydrolase